MSWRVGHVLKHSGVVASCLHVFVLCACSRLAMQENINKHEQELRSKPFELGSTLDSKCFDQINHASIRIRFKL